jgi:hypothetical protein
MARETGLEPATSGVTGRRHPNQIKARPTFEAHKKPNGFNNGENKSWTRLFEMHRVRSSLVVDPSERDGSRLGRLFKRRQGSPAPWRWRGATRQRCHHTGADRAPRGGGNARQPELSRCGRTAPSRHKWGGGPRGTQKRGRPKAASPEYQVVSEIRPSHAARYPFDDGTPRSRAPQNR